MFVFICHRAVLSVWSVSQLDDRDFLPHGHARESRGQPHSGHCKEDVHNILFMHDLSGLKVLHDEQISRVPQSGGWLAVLTSVHFSLLPVLSSYVPPLHVNAAELPVVSPIHVMSGVTCVQGPISRTEGLRAEGCDHVCPSWAWPEWQVTSHSPTSTKSLPIHLASLELLLTSDNCF